MIRNLACRGRQAALALAIASTVAEANAAPVTLNFAADFGLNFSQHPGGTAMAQLVETTYGPGTGTGQTVAVSGSITYDTATAAYQHIQGSDQSVANYLLPITGATLNLWGGSFTGDIAGIAGALPYFLQTGVSGSNGCLGIVGLCNGNPTGNAALVTDNGRVSVIDSNGHQVFASRDSVGFGLGYTVTSDDWKSAVLPPLLSDGEGNQLLLWGMMLDVVGKANKSLWNSAALPSNADFFDPEHLDYVSVSLALIGVPQGRIEDSFAMQLTSNASNFTVVTANDPDEPAGVPEPGSLELMLTSGSLLTMLRRGRKRRSDTLTELQTA